MKVINIENYLNSFFNKYTTLGGSLFYTLDSQAQISNKICLNVEVYQLKDELYKKYQFSELEKYIMEILVQLLKDDYDLDLIIVNFYDDLFSKPERFNLGNFIRNNLHLRN